MLALDSWRPSILKKVNMPFMLEAVRDLLDGRCVSTSSEGCDDNGEEAHVGR